MGELDAALKEASAGGGRMAVVSGEAGIGKTVLVEEFTRRLPSSVRVLWGACDALLTPRPLGLLYEIAPQMEGRVTATLDSGSPRSALFPALFLDLQEHPTASVLVFEDVHWADEASLDLIRYLGRRIHHAPALLVLTVREEEVGPEHPLRVVLGDLSGLAHLRRIPLLPLSEAAVRRMVAGVNVDSIALHRRTGGNPFFASEVLASGGAGLPASVRDAVLARAARLSPASKAVLEAAAVIGSRIEPGLLSEVAGADAPAVDALLEAGMLISQEGFFSFRNELARQSILESMAPSRRRALNQKTLAALRSSPASRRDLPRLVHHAAAAEDADAALEYAPEAARQATQAGAHREAAAHYDTALRFAGSAPDDVRASFLDARSSECYLTDQMEEAIQTRRQSLAIWQQMGNQRREAESLRWLARLVWHIGRWEEANRLSREAVRVLEPLPPGPELAMAYSYLSMVQMLAGQTTEAIRWGSQAIDLAHRLGATEVLVHALNSLGMAEWIDQPGTAPDKVLESLRLSLAHDLQDHAARAYLNIGEQAAAQRQYAFAMRYIAEGIEYSQGRDLDLMTRYIKTSRARVHLDLGHWAEASADAQEVLRARPSSAVVRLEALTVLGRVQVRQGDPAASQVLDQARQLAATMQETQRMAWLAAARAEAAWLRGNPAEAMAEAKGAYETTGRRPIGWELEELDFWMWRGGVLPDPPPRQESPYAMHMSGNWAGAASAWRQLGCPYEEAMALADGDEGAQLAAMEIFEKLGAQPALEIVRNRLLAIPQHRIDKHRYGGLTTRERQVAALIAQGKSNREIGESMVVGTRTVETYVTRILNKLGFDSRVQIATWAQERGLVAPSPPPDR